MPKLVVVATILTVGTGLVGPSAVGGGAAGTELRLFTHDTQQAAIDLGEAGDSLGDRFVFSGDVFDRRGGTRLGRLTGVCEAVGRGTGGGEDVCTVSFVLERGHLMVSSSVDHNGLFGGAPQAVAITGGTGIYRHARGDGTVTVLNATDADNVLHLR